MLYAHLVYQYDDYYDVNISKEEGAAIYLLEGLLILSWKNMTLFCTLRTVIQDLIPTFCKNMFHAESFIKFAGTASFSKMEWKTRSSYRYLLPAQKFPRFSQKTFYSLNKSETCSLEEFLSRYLSFSINNSLL